jgi:hypothetical protein
MVVPEVNGPTTACTPASASFCAASVDCFGSSWSSSETSWNCTALPAIFGALRLRVSMASWAEFGCPAPVGVRSGQRADEADLDDIRSTGSASDIQGQQGCKHEAFHSFSWLMMSDARQF